MSSFRSRAERFLSRRHDPTTDPVLLELAKRAISFAAQGHLISCHSCGGSGPVDAVAVLYNKPLSEGGKRTMDNASVQCFGCVLEAKRRDYVIASRVARLRPTTPISVIEA